jgi:hypothetical protein
MSKLSKSPLRVAREAFRTAQQVLPDYGHRFSPHVYTQPQLFTCLVLKTFFKTDYRGVVAILQDLPELGGLLALKAVPHFTTLQKASQRLLSVPRARRLLGQTVRRFWGQRRRVPRVAFDSTGLELGHRSAYFVRRRNGAAKRWQTVAYSRFAKLEAAIECRSHLLVTVLVGRGPRPDVDRFVPLLEATLANVQPGSVLADAGYDSESNHRYARERRGAFLHAGQARPADAQAALGALPAADAAAAHQALRELRAALAGRDGHLHGQTSGEHAGERPKLLGAVP